MMHDDVQSELLDAEFRQILYIIKPLINHINDHYHLERYRIWLERLSAVHPSEKLERNKYLLELANQIHDNALKPPFTYNPPKGLLPAIQILRRGLPEEDPARICEQFFKNKQNVEWPYVSTQTSKVQESPKRSVSAKDSTSSCDKKKRVKPKQPFQTLGRTEDGVQSETTSWCDLTETSTQGGDTDEEDRKSLGKKHKEEGLKTKELFMKKFSGSSVASKASTEAQKVQTFVKQSGVVTVDSKTEDVATKPEDNKIPKEKSRDSVYHPFGELTEKRSRGRKPTEQEVEALKMRMKDLLEVKNALRDTQCLTEDRKKTIETLQEKLAGVQRENVDLKTQVDSLEKKKLKLTQMEEENAQLQALLEEQQKKFMQMDQMKSKEIAKFKEKFTLLRQKEIEYLKQYHRNEINTLEKAHADQVADLQTKLETLEKVYEEKLRQLTDSNLSLLRQKDDEIQQLLSEMKVKQNQEEGNGEKVDDLKNCISKLEKALHKTDKEYSKKVEKLKQEIEVKDMTAEVKLQTQRADLILRNAAVRQEEMKTALNSLEGKYKKMMESLQIHALEAKKHDEQVIDELKEMLQKHKIQY